MHINGIGPQRGREREIYVIKREKDRRIKGKESMEGKLEGERL
jgi:hypothetical protein